MKNIANIKKRILYLATEDGNTWPDSTTNPPAGRSDMLDPVHLSRLRRPLQPQGR